MQELPVIQCSKKMGKDKWDAVSILTWIAHSICVQVLDDMVEKGWGRVINISSINGQKGQAGQTNYSAAKAGIHGFSMALAQEVAKRCHCKYNCTLDILRLKWLWQLMKKFAIRLLQVSQWDLGKPEEIAGLVTYLASDISGFMTGAELAINGCQHALCGMCFNS